MMKSVNYLLLAIMTVSFIAPHALAGVVITIQDETRIDSIVAHTGQDPVYRNYDGKHAIYTPLKEEKPNNHTPSIDTIDVLTRGTIVELDWSTVQTEYVNQFSIKYGDISVWGIVLHSGVGLENVYQPGGNNVPSPPTLMLLISGFAICKRRK